MSRERQQQSTPGLPPSILFRSFLLVTGAYVAHMVFLMLALMLIAATLFPAAYKILNGEPESYQEVFATQPERIFPREMLWLLLAVNAAVSFVLGWSISKLAPIGKFQHAIFLAVLLFVHFLQFAMGAEGGLQSMLVLFMGASPIAVLLGSNLCLRRGLHHETESCETETDRIP